MVVLFVVALVCCKTHDAMVALFVVGQASHEKGLRECDGGQSESPERCVSCLS
jgi:hypothetical protein